jgi:pilus assembly protein CpaE
MRSATALRALRPDLTPGPGVLAVIGETATRDVVASALGAPGMPDFEIVPGTVDAALDKLGAGVEPGLLVIDLSNSSAPVADIEAIAAMGRIDLRIVALGTRNDVQLYRDLIRAGAADYLVKPLDPAALGAALTFTKEASGTGAVAKFPARLGSLALFLGARGGVGTTTAALNTAWLLAHELNQRTALVDLDLHFGTVALALDINPGRGLREALEQPTRMDSLFIDRAMIRQGDRLSVLSAEEPVEDPVRQAEGAVDLLVKELRAKFDWVVVDVPRGLRAGAPGLLSEATHVAIVAEPTLASVRDTIRLETLVRDIAGTARLLMIDGGARRIRHSQVSDSDFEKALDRKLDVAIPFDAKAAALGANAGRPLVAAASTSPAAKALRQLSTVLAGPAPEPKGTFWRRFRLS